METTSDVFLWSSGVRTRRPSRPKTKVRGATRPAARSGDDSRSSSLNAIRFIVFDIEIVFLYPWAIQFRPLGMLGFVEMAVFVSILALGLVYVWRKGALDWE